MAIKGWPIYLMEKIRLLAEESLESNNYVVLLTKFDSSTFNATASEEGSFNDWYKKARKGVIFNIYLKKIIKALTIVLIVISPILPILIIKLKASFIPSSKRTIPDVIFDKEAKKKKINYFRDIPCNHDIYRAYFISTLYGLNKKESDLLGSVLLKWLNEEKIRIIETLPNLFNKIKRVIDFKKKEAIEVHLWKEFKYLELKVK